jgi:uncharacterized protein (TIGR00369 family)
MKHKYCFVCSSENEKGLKVEFERQGRKMEGTFIPGKEHQGYEGVTHGGVLASLLDAAMNRAVLEKGLNARTGKLVIRFFRPAPIGFPVKVVGETVKMRKRFVMTEAEILSIDGLRLATSKGVFLIER